MRREFFVPARTLIGVKLLSGAYIICASFFDELHVNLKTFQIFVCLQRLIARNVCELFNFNCEVINLNEACRNNEHSRGSVSDPKSYSVC
jgi:hypothetical protein